MKTNGATHAGTKRLFITLRAMCFPDVCKTGIDTQWTRGVFLQRTLGAALTPSQSYLRGQAYCTTVKDCSVLSSKLRPNVFQTERTTLSVLLK